jgi:hypothetical protein
MVTTDLGGQQPGDPGNGQFIVWFGEPEGADQTSCKVDIEIATAQSLLVLPDDSVLVVSARPPTSGVWRYTDLPTSADAAGGCGSTDVTGAPMADEVHKEQLLAPGQHEILSPAGIAFSPAGGYYVSSVITGVGTSSARSSPRRPARPSAPTRRCRPGRRWASAWRPTGRSTTPTSAS